MKNKTLFCVRLPATDKSFDLWVPHDLSVAKVTKLALDLLQEQEKRNFKADDNVSCYLKEDGEELDPNKLIGEYGFANGTTLVLI